MGCRAPRHPRGAMGYAVPSDRFYSACRAVSTAAVWSSRGAPVSLIEPVGAHVGVACVQCLFTILPECI